MNNFFNNLGQKLSQTTQDAVKKTKDFTEVTKINAQISTEQRNMQDLFRQLGEKFYLKYSDTPDTELQQFCSAIAAIQENIQNMKKEITRIQNVRVCPSCGTGCGAGSVFCPGCGKELPVEAEPAKKFCTNCGTAMDVDAVFCTNCGAKAAADDEPAAEDDQQFDFPQE